MDVQVVRADIDCVDRIAKLFDAYRGFYGQASNLLESYNFIAERISLGESAIFYAKDSSGEALGFVQLYPTFSSVAAQRTWLLNDLYAAEAARGRGVGTLLLNAAKAFAVSTGAKGILLETGRDNVGAQRLYEALGYIRDSGYYTYYLDLA